MKAVAILLTLIVLAPPGCQGEKGPKPKTGAPIASHYQPDPGPFRF